MPIDPAWKRENRTPRILIVDDDPEVADPVRFALEGLGYDVVHMPNGILGAQKLEEFQPDLLVLDMMMPGQSGFLVLEHIRRTKREQLRVIMVTANEGMRHQAYARMLGVDDYLLKPFSLEQLVGRVQELLDQPFPDDHPNASPR
jgi:DNA-binding response OmpR family regulator